MNKKIKILDCTLRDGGQGLDYNDHIGIKTEAFTDSEKLRIAELVRDSGIDIIEIGCMSESSIGRERFAVYENLSDLCRFLPERKDPRQIFTGLYIDPDTPVDKIPEHTPEMVDGIRVILRYSQLKKSVDFCASLAKKGYKTFIQPMLTMRYTDDELKMLVDSANEMGAYALYFVDSFGYMDERDIERLYRFYGEGLDESVRIGFHAHNNMENAFSNARYFIENLADRECIIDSCAAGMGQGAGNLQTEIIVDHMNKHYGTEYDFDCVLEVCDILEKFRSHDMEVWGYSPLRFIPAVHKAAYKYAAAMKLDYKMSLSEINKILSDMPLEMRHRYTADDLKKLLGK
ncbi:MAG: hypothetical protein ACI4J0_08975 [Huintestinicola sp.]|uniref:hypothetical protein n=1 Tax=Huintestinicola sp. TaxID=2981661 RepID=UPI003F0D6FF0